MHRELGDERARYGRKTLREQLDDAFAWPARNRAATAIVLIVVVGGAVLWLAGNRAVELGRLAVGECLYVPTAAANDPVSTRPIGDSAAVEDVILVRGAERADCTASHGHEVSAIVVGPEPSAIPVPTRGVLDRDAIRRATRPLCEAAFAGYVGHDLAGSAYTTFPVAPEATAWLAAGRTTVCLVARVDGQWMGQPARGSGG